MLNDKTEIKKRRILRKNTTKAEEIIWNKLRNRQLLGSKFRRQYSVGSYVIDFYCPKFKLAVEIDGDTHFTEEAEEYDKQRENFINKFGINILRFTNDDENNFTLILSFLRRGDVDYIIPQRSCKQFRKLIFENKKQRVSKIGIILKYLLLLGLRKKVCFFC